MEQITIGTTTIDVIRKNIKNLHLAVHPPNGRVRIAVPEHTTDDNIRLFAISKIGWIKKNQKKLTLQERIPPREYKTRESHYLWGHRYLFYVIEENAVPHVVLKNKNRLELHIRPGTPVEKCHQVMQEFYRQELNRILPELIIKWEKNTKLKLIAWKIRSMKLNWGTCNIEKKSITLNLELAKKPVRCLEYIILHEMLHLLERNHNDRFRKYMDIYMPRWQQIKDELNRLPLDF